MDGTSLTHAAPAQASIGRAPGDSLAAGLAMITLGVMILAVLFAWLASLQRRARAKGLDELAADLGLRPEMRRARKLSSSFPPPARVPTFSPRPYSMAPPPDGRTPSGGKVGE